MERSKGFPGRIGPIGSAVALILLVTGCVSSGSSTKPIPQPSETEDLRRKLVAMEQRAIMGEVEAKRLKAEVKRLEAELREVKEQAKTAAVAAPAAPIQDGTGSVVLQPALDSVELEEPVPPVAESPTDSGSSGTEPVTAYANRSAQDIYDQGYSLFHQRRYAQAELAFSQVLEHHPRDGLADNALFWIGESRYARDDYQGALEAFTGTVERYPQGNKVGDAMLKAGKCLEALGQTQRAVDTYRELGTLFPDTAAALVAQERLEALQ